jgi:hypothetical protein
MWVLNRVASPKNLVKRGPFLRACFFLRFGYGPPRLEVTKLVTSGAKGLSDYLFPIALCTRGFPNGVSPYIHHPILTTQSSGPTHEAS